MKYCSECGSRLTAQDRPGDRAPRYACRQCHAVFYLDPRLVVACLTICDDRVLLCTRGVAPGYGLWNLPCGFIEKGELASRAAVREALEEAQTTVELGRPYALFHMSLRALAALRAFADG